jgi:hypothetical protein
MSATSTYSRRRPSRAARNSQAGRDWYGRFPSPDRFAIRDNHGTLSVLRRRGEFAQLRDDEVARIEQIVRDSFEGFSAKSEAGA